MRAVAQATVRFSFSGIDEPEEGIAKRPPAVSQCRGENAHRSGPHQQGCCV